MIRIDHIGLPAKDAQSSARHLASLLGTDHPTVDGADDDMYRIDVGQGAFVLFNPATSIDVAHVAFRVDTARFEAIVSRLRERHVPFGNDPEAPDNAETKDPLGGIGRVYFTDDNGHLFEVTC